MRFSTKSAAKVLVVFGAAATATVLMAGSAAAAVNDNFMAATTNGCGAINFIDFGPGAPGGGDNDDYLVIHDYCADSHGVMGYTWLNGVYLGMKYNGNGLAGAAVVWDPYKAVGNVLPGDRIVIQVCLVDGASDPTPSGCVAAAHISADG